MDRTIPIFIFLLMLAQTFCLAQGNVFVLVDVSGSGPSVAKSQARDLVRDIVLAQFDPSKHDPKWKWSNGLQTPLDPQKGATQPLLDFSTNPTLVIMPMGGKDSYKNYKIAPVASPAEASSFFARYYPPSFNDPYSYLDIARAKAAGVARSIPITEFYQIEITDALEDTDSKQLPYTQEEWALIQSNTSSVTYLGEMTYDQENTAFAYRIIFKKVQVNNSIPKTPIVGGGVNVAQKEVNIIKPRGTLKKPTPQNPGSVSIAWQCYGCKDSTEFTVTVTNTTNRKVRISPQKTRNFSTVLAISEPGIYKVSVAGDGASARSVYFEVKGNSGKGGGFLGFLLLALAAGAVWFFWNKRRNQRIENDPNDYTGGMNSYTPPPSTPVKKPFEDDSF